MKYKLIIDKSAEEEITVIAHAPSSLTQQIEDLVCRYSGADCIMGYRDDEMRKLEFSGIECITIIDRKVTAIDNKGNHYSLKDRLRDLEDILPSCFIRINKSTLANEHHSLRNSNPLSHSSSELLDDNNTSNELSNSIKDLSKLIYGYIDKQKS